MSASSQPVAAQVSSDSTTERVAALKQVFATLAGGIPPWAVYANGTVLFLDKATPPASRDELITTANTTLGRYRTVAGTPAGDFNVSEWKEKTAAGGNIIITMYSAVGITTAMTIDVSRLPGPIYTAGYGLAARGRKDKDVSEKKIVATSMDA